MERVIDLAAFRERRAQGKKCHRTRPPDISCHDDLIHLQHQPDGSYTAQVTGVYADDLDLALKTMVDATERLAAANPRIAIQLLAAAIGNLAMSARA